MPARSEAQRRYLFATKGEGWVRRHHFDTKGELPQHARKGHARREALKRMRKKKHRG